MRTYLLLRMLFPGRINSKKYARLSSSFRYTYVYHGTAVLRIGSFQNKIFQTGVFQSVFLFAYCSWFFRFLRNFQTIFWNFRHYKCKRSNFLLSKFFKIFTSCGKKGRNLVSWLSKIQKISLAALVCGLRLRILKLKLRVAAAEFFPNCAQPWSKPKISEYPALFRIRISRCQPYWPPTESDKIKKMNLIRI